MKHRLLHIAIMATALISIASCGPADSDPGAGGVTAGDAKALDEAAEKLDNRDAEAAKDEAD
jgi:hypothetical protein